MQEIILETNAADQIVLWVAELVNQIVVNWGAISTALAFGLTLYLGSVLWGRFQSSADPSLRMQRRSAGGSVSVLISGVHVTGMLLIAIAFLTWPLVVETPIVGAMMAAVFVAHYWIEKREVGGN